MSLNRREFLFAGAAGLFAGCRMWGEAPAGEEPLVRFGMVTDLHFADLPPDRISCGVVGWRYYRESRRKLAEAVDVFNARGLDFAIELGDFKDMTDGPEETLRHLESIEDTFAKFDGPRYHVTGNHDLDCLSPEEFYARVPNDGVVSSTGYYSFVVNGVTFVVLNATYRADGTHWSRRNVWDDANIPPAEAAWLEKTLKLAEGDVYVFCHQRLDDSADRLHLVKNAPEIRGIFERSGKVKGVFTGHQHMGGQNVQGGIPYYSLRALVHGSGEGANSFAEVAVYPSGAFTVTGWRNAASREAKGEFPEVGLIAHRGDAAEYPENTRQAFDAAVAKGAEMVELDEWRCKTGELVVMHDPRVERTTDGRGRIADLTLSEIRALDAGSKFDRVFAGERVPLLYEALACFPKTGVYLNIHCKTGDAAPEVAALLKRTGRLAQGILMMDSRRDLIAVKAKCPWAKTGLVMNTDGGWAKPWSEGEAWKKLRDAASLGVDFVQILPNCHVTREQLRFLHDRGIRTTYFFANDAAKMRELLAEGHDFVFTDRYGAMRKVYDIVRAET